MIYHELTPIRRRNRDSRPELANRHLTKPGTGFVLLPALLFLPFTLSETDYPPPSKSRTRLLCVTCRKGTARLSVTPIMNSVGQRERGSSAVCSSAFRVSYDLFYYLGDVVLDELEGRSRGIPLYEVQCIGAPRSSPP